MFGKWPGESGRILAHEESLFGKMAGSWIAAQLSRVFNVILGINLGKNGQLKSFWVGVFYLYNDPTTIKPIITMFNI